MTDHLHFGAATPPLTPTNLKMKKEHTQREKSVSGLRYGGTLVMFHILDPDVLSALILSFR